MQSLTSAEFRESTKLRQKMWMFSRIAKGFVYGMVAMGCFVAHADTWPTKSVRWIVPFAAGGAADAAARVIAQKLGEKWGQAVMVDNKPGANTLIGAVEAARAPADGYTLFQAQDSTLTMNRFLYSKLPYNPKSDFTYIATIAAVPLIVVAGESLKIDSFPELERLAKSNPEKITVGTGSLGVQLAYELLSRDTKLKFQLVPYKSGSDVSKGILTSEIQVGIDGVVAYLPYHASKQKLRVLAAISEKRIPALPDVPTMAELGFANSGTGVFHGVLGPANLPSHITNKISDDLKSVLALPDVVSRLRLLGIEPMWGSSADFVSKVELEATRVGPVMRELGMRLD